MDWLTVVLIVGVIAALLLILHNNHKAAQAALQRGHELLLEFMRKTPAPAAPVPSAPPTSLVFLPTTSTFTAPPMAATAVPPVAPEPPKKTNLAKPGDPGFDFKVGDSASMGAAVRAFGSVGGEPAQSNLLAEIAAGTWQPPLTPADVDQATHELGQIARGEFQPGQVSLFATVNAIAAAYRKA